MDRPSPHPARLRLCFPLGAALAAAVLAGCAAYFPLNAPLEHWSPTDGYRMDAPRGGSRSGELLLVVSLSGGGMRAAALSYGVLAELARSRVRFDGAERRLLDEIDLLSAVSGGSFTAAYYGLYGDRLFEDYERRFLKRNVTIAMLGQLFDPRNWPRLFSTYFERSELAAEYYDRRLFGGATYADLAARPGAPVVLINATDLSQGSRFGFVQEQFDLICSDLSRFPVSRAVAASSAVPLVLSPVILRNYAGSCDALPPAWIREGLELDGSSLRRRAHAQRAASYLSAGRRPYVHLIDGAISDNLGVRGPLHWVLLEGGAGRGLQAAAHPNLRQILFVVVDAATEPSSRWDQLDYAPPLAAVVDAVTSIQLIRYNFETLELLRAVFDGFVAERSKAGREVGFQLVHVGFDALSDPDERDYFGDLSTSLNLPDEAIERLEDLGGRLLRESPEYRAALESLR